MIEQTKTLVVSAVNLRKGGTLTILRQCLEYLSRVAPRKGIRVVALVHDRSLCEYPGIEYREMPWCTKSWFHRLWAEYVTMHRISMEIAAQDCREVWLWLSLHDTTPRVVAERREVYCHTSFPFLKLKARDFVMDPKIPAFALLTRWAYRINVRNNDWIIVQQEWFADELSSLLHLDRGKFRVIPPSRPHKVGSDSPVQTPSVPVFFYASTPDCHKNFETLCEAAKRLEEEVGKDAFKVVLTIKGDENRYARWLFKHWGEVPSIDFHGFMTKDELYGTYASAGCFVFPSRIETWGLPISEYMAENPQGRMLLADLSYAHETSAGAQDARFFKPTDPGALFALMREYLEDRKK